MFAAKARAIAAAGPPRDGAAAAPAGAGAAPPGAGASTRSTAKSVGSIDKRLSAAPAAGLAAAPAVPAAATVVVVWTAAFRAPPTPDTARAEPSNTPSAQTPKPLQPSPQF